MNTTGRTIYGWGLLLTLILLIYGNTFKASWHFDDYPNIVDNPRLHLSQLNLRDLVRSFYLDVPGSDAKRIYRPVARMSLAMNWYLGRNDVTGYHAVNLLIHGTTAGLLFMTFLALFQTPKLRGRSREDVFFIALLAAVLWAVNPVQTQAVTYIVQRMAALAALFTVLAIYLYLKGRLRTGHPAQYGYFAGAFISFLLAIGSKENAILLPLSLILLECCCFLDLSQAATRRRLLRAVLGTGVVLVLGGCLLLFLKKGDPLAYVRTMYQNRPFALHERLLTEPRVVVFYLSQLFYPMPQRLSIEHDVIVSSTLTVPWTTLPAMGIIVLLIGLGISQVRSRPLIALALLFFFLNHLPESTIFPLELVFEHRNYLPSLFLFLPVAAGIRHGVNYYKARNITLAAVIVAGVVLLIVGLGVSTHLRNAVWQDEIGLWQDALAKAPGSGRSYHNLAWGYYQPRGQDQKALAYYRLALDSFRHKKKNAALTLTNMGYLYLAQGKLDQSLKHFRAALRANPDYEKAFRGLVQTLIQMQRFEEAVTILKRTVPQKAENFAFQELMGQIFLRRQDAHGATPYLTQSVLLKPGSWKARFYLGIALEINGNHEASAQALLQAQRMRPQDPRILLLLSLNRLNADQPEAADVHIERLLAGFPLARIIDGLQQNMADVRQRPLTHDRVAALLARKVRMQADAFRDRAGSGKVLKPRES